MKCDCYKKAIYPVIELLEKADGILYYRTPDEEIIRQKIHEIIVSLNTNFRCIDECHKKENKGI